MKGFLFMKLKKLALIGMVVLATMSACGKKSTEESTEAQTTVEGETQADLGGKRTYW